MSSTLPEHYRVGARFRGNSGERSVLNGTDPVNSAAQPLSLIAPLFGSATIKLTHCLLSGRRLKDRHELCCSFRRCGGDGHGKLIRVVGTSILALLRERASLQPDDTVFTFIDYEQD
jgi:hypothetical protein